jgi:plasmid stability protein
MRRQLGGRDPMDMCRTCLYAHDMSKMIQVRDVPDHVHGTLKSRAAREGMSLSDFIKRELERVPERPTMQEWLERTQQTKPISAKAKPIRAKKSAAQVIRELRDER